MRLIIWHGYLLADTGSNVYTRHIARSWARLGHEVTVLCQEPHPERYDLPASVRVVRPDIGPLLPVFVVDRYEGVEARHVADMDDAELRSYLDANVSALRAECDRGRPFMVLANHAIMGGPVASEACRAAGVPYAVKVHGSELEYAIRGRPRLAAMAADSLAGAAAVYAGSRHIVDVTAELLGPGGYLGRTHVVPPGVDLERFTPEGGSWQRLHELLERPPAAGAHAERRPDPDAAERLRGVDRFVLYVGKLLHQKGVGTLLDAWRRCAPLHPRHSLVVVGFGSDRAELEQLAGDRVVFTGAMDHEELAALVPLADATVVPSVLPEAFGMVAAEAAACGVLPIVSDHSGLAEVAEGLGRSARTFDGSPADLAARIGEVLEMDEGQRIRLGEQGRAVVAERWSWERVAADLIAAVSLTDGTNTVDSP